MSSALQRIGVKQGDVVLLLLPNVPHFPVCITARCAWGRHCYSPPTSVEREIEALIKDSGARVIVTLDMLFEKVANISSEAA